MQLLTLLGGVCFLAQSLNTDGPESRSAADRMFTLLRQAISTDHLALAHIVLNWQPDIINCKDDNGWTPLHLAAETNASTMILAFCDKVAEKEMATKLGNTPLLVAAMAGNEEAMKALLAKKANPNVANTHKWTPVHYAAVANNAQMLELLHQHGGELQSTTLKGNNPFSLAVMNDLEGAAKFLMKKNAALVKWRNSYNWTVLHLAASCNGLKMLKRLSGLAEIDLNAVTSKGHTPLAIAVMQKCLQAAEVLLKAKANPDVPNTKGWTALHIAAEKDACNMVGLLCEVGANTEVQTDLGSTPLCIAAMHGHRDVVAELLRQNANPNARNHHGWCAIHYAASAENSVRRVKHISQADGVDKDLKADEMSTPQLTNKGSTVLALSVLSNSVGSAKALLLGKADPNMCGDHGWSPLHLAAERNYAEIVELLCSFGANPNATNQQGYTPLVISVAKDSKEAAGALLKVSANPNAQSELNGWAALHFAAQEDNQALGKLLCDFNADHNVRTHENNPPLLIAALNGSKSMTSTLLSRKADANACDSHGWTALHCAAQENASEIVFLLCASSADVEARTDKGNTPLAIAAIHNSDVAAEQLIKMGADVNAKNCDDWTPLCCAVYSGSFDSNLIEHLCSPANVSMQTKQHGTPLHLSVLKQNLVYVSCLLKCGADPHIQDNRGDTPLNVALRSKSVDIAEAIQKHNMMQDPVCNAILDVMIHPGKMASGALHYTTHGVLSDRISLLDDKNPECIDLNAVGKYGNTPLHIAARDGDKNVVLKILQQDVELANRPGENGYLPIQLAVMGNHIAVVELLSHYCDAKGLTDDKGYTLLHLAAKWNSAQTAKHLLSDGHKPDSKDNHGYCPIHVAAHNGSTKVIAICLAHDVGMIFLLADNGYTILHCAAERGQLEVVQLICSKYPDAVNINAMTDLGETPIHIATASTAPDAAEVIRMLREFGAEPNMPTADCIKDMALHFAVLTDNEEKARALLSADPKLVDRPGFSGEVPLHWAVKKSNSKMIDILCQANCDVNAGDQYGNIPLHFATACTSNVAIVQQLLANGAAPEKPNHAGLTPLDVAADMGVQNFFLVIHNEAEKAWHIDKSFNNMQRIHHYVQHRQMEKAGMLMSKSVTNVQ